MVLAPGNAKTQDSPRSAIFQVLRTGVLVFMIVYGLSCKCHPERGIRYVGLSKNPIGHRMSDHRRSANNPKTPVGYWLQKHGRNNLSGQIIEECTSIEHMKSRERFWIAHYRSLGQADLNLTDGGDGMFGMKLSPEHVEALKRANTGRIKSPETRARLSASLMGHEVDQATRDKISATNTGRVFSDDELVSRYPHDTISPSGLTRRDIPTIRERIRAGHPYADIADCYGVTIRVISSIARGHTWTRIGDNGEYDPTLPKKGNGVKAIQPTGKLLRQKNVNGRFSDDQVLEILKLSSQGLSQSVIADSFGCTQASISRVVRGESYQWVDRP